LPFTSRYSSFTFIISLQFYFYKISSLNQTLLYFNQTLRDFSQKFSSLNQKLSSLNQTLSSLNQNMFISYLIKHFHQIQMKYKKSNDPLDVKAWWRKTEHQIVSLEVYPKQKYHHLSWHYPQFNPTPLMFLYTLYCIWWQL
jgi:hypothetical protein